VVNRRNWLRENPPQSNSGPRGSPQGEKAEGKLSGETPKTVSPIRTSAVPANPVRAAENHFPNLGKMARGGGGKKLALKWGWSHVFWGTYEECDEIHEIVCEGEEKGLRGRSVVTKNVVCVPFNFPKSRWSRRRITLGRSKRKKKSGPHQKDPWKKACDRG